MSKSVPSIVVKRFLASVELRTEIEALTDGELARQLTEKVWTRDFVVYARGNLD